MYLSLRYCSTALTSSSPSYGKGILFEFHFLFAFLFPIRRNWLICSSVQLSKVNDLTFDMLWLGGPRTRLCTEAHLPHNNIPKVYEAQVGCEAPHSPHLLSLPLLLTASINCLSFSFCCFLLNIGKNGGSVGR